jgi:UDP-glucuronate decarboxylase
MIEFCLPDDIAEIADGLGDTADAFDGKRILIAGGMGFLGRYFTAVFAHLSKNRLQSPCRVIVLDSMITATDAVTKSELGRGIEFRQQTITEPFADEEGFDFVIHAAGIASPYYYRKYPLETLDVATVGTKNMLDLARAHEARLLYFSSSEIYGDPDADNVPTSESYRGNVSCLGPRACYDESKRLGETLCRIYHEEFGVRSRMVRPFNVYGPGMQKTDYRVLPNFAAHIVAGEALNVYGAGSQTRTFCYVTDAVVGFLKVLVYGSHGEPYNIGNTRPEISIIDLVGEIETVLGRKLDVHRVDYPDTYPADEPNRRCPDITKARLQLGYKPQIDLPAGLARFFGWAEATYAQS